MSASHWKEVIGMVLVDMVKFMFKALRCPSVWYCVKAGRLDCAACSCWLRNERRVEFD